MLNSSDIEDTFVQTNQDAGTPSLEGAADGSGSIFSNLFQAATAGYGAYQKYDAANTATAKAAAPAIVTQAQDTNRLTLWAVIAGVGALILFLVIKRK